MHTIHSLSTDGEFVVDKWEERKQPAQEFDRREKAMTSPAWLTDDEEIFFLAS